MRLIDADTAQKIADSDCTKEDAGTVQYVLSHTPTIEAQPVRRGHWIKNAERQGWHCSECGQDNVYAFILNWDGTVDALQDYFCPNCGAKMDGEV